MVAAFFGLILFSLESQANAGWPAAWAFGSMAQAAQKFWFLVVASLIVETWLLWKFSKIPAWKTAMTVLIANAVSAAAGAYLCVGMMYTDGVLYDMGQKGQTTFTIDLVIILSLSVAIESLVVRFFWKAQWKKLLAIMSVSNVTSHILGVIYLFSAGSS